MSQESYLYTESHEWIEPAGEVRRVGISDHAQHLLGDIVFVDLPKVGRKVKKGEDFIVVESPKAAAEVYAPVSGEVVEVNTALEGEPTLINQSPYADGWLVKIKLDNPAEASSLMSLKKYLEVTEG